MQADGSMAEASEFHAACAVLGLNQAPSMSEAKSAFRVRAALLHPDVHQSGGAHRMEAATDAMQQLNDAYQLVLTSLEAGNTKPVIRGQRAVVRRCSRCRYRFQDTANEAMVVCPRCGQRHRGASRGARSYSRPRLRSGREIVSVKRRTTQQRREPIGRLAHLSLWLDG